MREGGRPLSLLWSQLKPGAARLGDRFAAAYVASGVICMHAGKAAETQKAPPQTVSGSRTRQRTRCGAPARVAAEIGIEPMIVLSDGQPNKALLACLGEKFDSVTVLQSGLVRP